MQEPPKKKKNVLLIVIIAVVLVAVLLGAGGFVVYGVFLQTPQAQLAKGFAAMGEEIHTYQSAVTDKIDFEQFGKALKNEPYAAQMDGNITFPVNSDIDNISFSLQSGLDYQNRKFDLDFGVGMYQVNVIEGTITAEDDTIYVALPKLLSDTYALSLVDLGRNYNASAWAAYLEQQLDEDFSLDLFAEESEEEELSSDAEDGLLEPARKMLAEAELTKAEEKAELTIAGETVACNGISVRITQESVNTFLVSFWDEYLASPFYQEFLEESLLNMEIEQIEEQKDYYEEQIKNIQFGSDITLTIYLDKKGRIVRMETPQDIVIILEDAETSNLGFTFDCTGEARTLDEINGEIRVSNQDMSSASQITRNAYLSEDINKEAFTVTYSSTLENSTSFSYERTWNWPDMSFDIAAAVQGQDYTIKASANGAIDDYVKNESGTLRIVRAGIDINDINYALLAGKMSVEKTQEPIEIPQQSVDLLGMSEDDIYLMLYEIVLSMNSYGDIM